MGETAHTAGSHGGSVGGLGKIKILFTSCIEPHMVRYVDTAPFRKRVRLLKRYKRFGRNVRDVFLHKMSLWALCGELGASYWDGNTVIVTESCEMTVRVGRRGARAV